MLGPGALFGGLQWILEEVARAQEMAQQQQAARSGSDGLEEDLDRPLAGRGHDFGFLSQGGGPDILPLPHPSSRSGATGTVLDGHDWGSSTAVAAVKKLQSMGAQVFPPGSKEKVDWGVLAGTRQDLSTTCPT